MKSSLSFLVAVGGLLIASGSASAQEQPWLKDRRYTEGMGYRVGDYELHPGVATEFGYDSNFFHFTDNPAGSLRLRITPSLSFTTLSPQRLESSPGERPSATFHGGFAVSYNEFFGVGNNVENVKWDAQRNVSGTLDLGLAINPGRAWSGTLSGSVARVITPSEASVQDTTQSFNRDIPQAAVEVAYAPGAGLFEWRLGYQVTGTIYESSSFSYLTNVVNQLETRGRWRFLPRTSLLYDARFGFLTYPTPDTAASAGSKTGGHPVRAYLGLSGLVTNSLSVLVMGGWGASFYTPAPQQDFDSAIGQVELRWFLNPPPATDAVVVSGTMSSVAVGFLRDFYDSVLGPYYERDRGYVSVSHLFAGKFLVVAEGGVGPMVFPAFNNGIGPVAPFTDIRIDGSLFGEYRFQDAFGVNATLRYNQEVNNNASIPQTGGAPPATLAFQQFEAYLGVRWLM